MRTDTFAGERTCGIPKPAFRSELFFSKLFYYYLMVSNLVLRLAWTYKLSPHLRRNHDTVLAFTLLEVRASILPAYRLCSLLLPSVSGITSLVVRCMSSVGNYLLHHAPSQST